MGGQVENRDKMENAPNSGMFRGNISRSPLEYQSLSSYIFLTYNIHIFIHESPEISNNCSLA